MKKVVQLLIASVLLFSVFGCATSSDEKYATRLRPPLEFNPHWLSYQKLPGQKVMVIAVDPGDSWAFGYDHGRATLAEAAENAAVNCDNARKENKVLTKAKLFAINDDIVYYDKQFK